MALQTLLLPITVVVYLHSGWTTNQVQSHLTTLKNDLVTCDIELNITKIISSEAPDGGNFTAGNGTTLYQNALESFQVQERPLLVFSKLVDDLQTAGMSYDFEEEVAGAKTLYGTAWLSKTVEEGYPEGIPHLASHEMGHLLGLPHAGPFFSGKKIMHNGNHMPLPNEHFTRANCKMMRSSEFLKVKN